MELESILFVTHRFGSALQLLSERLTASTNKNVTVLEICLNNVIDDEHNVEVAF